MPTEPENGPAPPLHNQNTYFPQPHPLTFSYTKQRGAVWLSPPGSRSAGIAGRTSEIAPQHMQPVLQAGPEIDVDPRRTRYARTQMNRRACGSAVGPGKHIGSPGRYHARAPIPSHFRVEGSPRAVPMDRHRRPPMEMIVSRSAASVFLEPGITRRSVVGARPVPRADKSRWKLESQRPYHRPEIDN